MKAFASGVRSFHLPLLTKTEAMESAETGQGLAGLLRLVKRVDSVPSLAIGMGKINVTNFFFPSLLSLMAKEVQELISNEGAKVMIVGVLIFFIESVFIHLAAPAGTSWRMDVA